MSATVYHGQGVPADLPAAVQWFRKAAQQGDPDAQQALASLASIAGGAA